MENASKALIMAAEVLIGVIIISIGVTLFSMFQNYSKDAVDKLNESKISEFNNNFLKYEGTFTAENKETGKSVEIPIYVTAHDIITMANFAKENNEYYELNINSAGDDTTFYVQVNIGATNGLETWGLQADGEAKQNDFLDKNSLRVDELGELKAKYYKCSCLISSVTNRVYKVNFTEFTNNEYKLADKLVEMQHD